MLDYFSPTKLLPTTTAWDSMFVFFSAELGAKAFVATGFFAMWCPINGLRNSAAPDAYRLVGLVFSGAFIASCSQLFVYKSGLAPNAIHGGMNLILLLAMCFVAAKVFEDLTFADEREKMILRADERQRAMQEPQSLYLGPDFSTSSLPVQSEEAAPVVGGNPFLGNFRPYDPALASPGAWSGNVTNQDAGKDFGYGSVADNPFAGSNSEGADDRPSDDSRLAAFLIPFGVVYVLEANDKTWSLLKSFDDIGKEVAYGICLAYLLTSLCAVLSGVIVARFLSESRKLFVISCWLIFMLITTSSGVMTDILKIVFKERLFSPSNDRN